MVSIRPIINNFKTSVFLLRLVGKLGFKKTSTVTVVTQTNCTKSVCNWRVTEAYGNDSVLSLF